MKAERSSIEASTEDVRRPRSAVSQRTAFIGLFSLLLAMLVVDYWQPRNRLITLIFLGLAIAVPIIALERPLHKFRASRDHPQRATDWPRICAKLLGLSLTFLVVALAYWLFPVYRSGQANVIWDLARYLFLPIAIITPFYVWWTDSWMDEPEDGLYFVGRFAQGYRPIDQMEKVRQYVLAWLVKAFFLPIMLTFSINELNWLLATGVWKMVSQSRFGWYEFSYRFVYLVDVIWASVGYCLTLRLLNSEIRSTEPTAFGWIVCLICYQPFWGMVSGSYLNYEDNLYWGDWIGSVAIVGQVWATIILLLTLIYAWATVSFGIRFSNLTHRGILTNGPYRWTKHPAYVCKNITWWMISLPFLVNGTMLDAARLSLLLGTVNLVYYFRAKTEEWHLAKDPEYVAYCAWIERHGLFAQLRNIAVRLAFRAG